MIFRSIQTVSVILLMLLPFGCGRKTALVPPQRLVPVRINDLQYVLDANGVTLRWSYPVKMESGGALPAIERLCEWNQSTALSICRLKLVS